MHWLTFTSLPSLSLSLSRASTRAFCSQYFCKMSVCGHTNVLEWQRESCAYASTGDELGGKHNHLEDSEKNTNRFQNDLTRYDYDLNCACGVFLDPHIMPEQSTNFLGGHVMYVLGCAHQDFVENTAKWGLCPVWSFLSGCDKFNASMNVCLVLLYDRKWNLRSSSKRVF